MANPAGQHRAVDRDILPRQRSYVASGEDQAALPLDVN
jgi:hypothetical protein